MKHRISIEGRHEFGFVAVRRYRAKCSGCKFRGEWKRKREAAEADGRSHVTVLDSGRGK